MSQYIPQPAPFLTDDMKPGEQIKAIQQWAGAELSRIARCRVESENILRLKVLYAPPLKYAPGDVVYADGAQWNPGLGEGIYRRSLAGTWVSLG